MPSGVRKTLMGIADFLFPDQCLGCGKGVSISSLHLCESCFRSLEESTDVFPLGKPGDFREPENDYPGATLLWRYDPGSPVRNMHRAVKYDGYVSLGRQMGRLLGRKLGSGSHSVGDVDLIVPVPIHRVRRRNRLYNQAAEIARGVSDILAIPLDETFLLRVKPGLSQTGLTRQNRFTNLVDAFALARAPLPDGSHIIVVDDVITTGATMCAVIDTIRAGSSVRCTPAAVAGTPA
jgi:ComF family protein